MHIRTFENYTPQLAEGVFVDETAVVIGNVKLGHDASIWPMAAIRGDINYIHIGNRTNIQEGSVLHVSHECEYTCPGGHPLTIGENVTVGHNVTLHACSIGNLCLIGMGAVVMDNAAIADQVIIGAGALVPPNKVLQSGYLYVGNPLRQVRQLSEEEKTFLQYSADYYVELKNRHMAASSL